MKHILILLLISSLVLAGCSQQKTQNEPSEISIFEKKERCANYIENIYKQEKMHRENLRDTSEYWIDEVFYSPVVDSCLYVVKEMPLDDITYKSMFVIDALTLKTVSQMFIPTTSLQDKTAFKDEAEFEQIIQELKGEK